MGTGLLLLTLSLGAITYHVETVVGGGPGVRAQFTADQLVVLQKLNRADLAHLDRLPALVIPDLWVDDELAYSPMPRRYPPGERHRRVVVVYLPAQVFGAYEYGALKLGTPILILGEYDFAAAPPWQSLLSLSQPLTLPEM